MRTGAPVRDDRGPQPGHPRLGELLSEGECPNPVPPSRRLDRATPALLHRPAMAEYGVAALSHVPSGGRARTGSADPSGALGQDHPPPTATTTKESGSRENRTSRLSERTEEGRKPDLLRLYRSSSRRLWGWPLNKGRCSARHTVEDLRQALLVFREVYNTTSLIERHGSQTPAAARQNQLSPAAGAA